METLINHPYPTSIGIIAISLALRYGSILREKKDLKDKQKKGYRTIREEADYESNKVWMNGFVPVVLGLTFLVGTTYGSINQNGFDKILAIPAFFHIGEAIAIYLYDALTN